MARTKKSQTVPGKWTDSWFMQLTPQDKLVFLYVIDNCDYIGVYELNEKLMRTQIGFSQKVDLQDCLKNISEKVEPFKNGKNFWVKNYIRIQFGVLGTNSSIHISVLKELFKYRNNEQIGNCFKAFLQENEANFCTLQVPYKYPKRTAEKREEREEKNINTVNTNNNTISTLQVPYKYPTNPHTPAHAAEEPPPGFVRLVRERKPKIPDKETVLRAFMQQGGTLEQAEAFYNKHEAFGWEIQGNPIRNFTTLIPNFLNTWQKIRNATHTDDPAEMAKKAHQRAVDEANRTAARLSALNHATTSRGY